MLSVILSTLAFLLLLTSLVLLHEFGHFFAARRAKVMVEEFGIGLPPRAKTLFYQGGTRFSLNWVPFGGFVRLKGENIENERDRRQAGSFAAASAPAKIIILTAGVLMNFVFAILLFTIGFSAGRWIPTYLTFDQMLEAGHDGVIELEPGVLIDEVIPGGGAAEAKLPVPSVLLKVDATPIRLAEQVAPAQQGKTSVTYTLLMGEKFTEQRTVKIALKDGKTGVNLRSIARELSAPMRSPITGLMLALREAKVVTYQSVVGMVHLFRSIASGGRIPEGITGIVGIAQLTHASLQEGFMTYLRLVALLSVSLAVLNILPLPALDGGRLLFVLIEIISRRPANRRFEMITNMVGFAFLILLVILITYHDLLKLF